MEPTFQKEIRYDGIVINQLIVFDKFDFRQWHGADFSVRNLKDYTPGQIEETDPTSALANFFRWADTENIRYSYMSDLGREYLKDILTEKFNIHIAEDILPQIDSSTYYQISIMKSYKENREM